MSQSARDRFVPGWSLDPDTYVSSAWWERERERVFGNQWIAVARASELPESGDFVARNIGSEPVLLVRRSKEAGFAAYANVCRHRGSVMLEGKGRVGRIVCPYHRWTYGLDGKLIGAPLMEEAREFRKERCGLPRFQVEEWFGWVFVHLGAEPQPLAPRIEELATKLPADLADWVTATILHYEIDANWKIVVENFSESYHHLGVHEQTLQPFWPAAKIRDIVTNGSYAEIRHPLDPALGTFTVYTIFPTTMFAVLEPEALCTWFELQAENERRSIVDIHLVMPRERAADADVVAQASQTLARIQDEDTAVILKVQRGVRSRFARPGPLSTQEGSLATFHAWLARALGSTD